MMRVAVTGGAGFIGANLVRTLLQSGIADEVVALDDLSSGHKSNVEGLTGARLKVATVLDDDALDAAFSGVEAIVHLAALVSVPRSVEEPLETNDINATGTLRVLEAARRAGGVYTVVASSSSVYGANPTTPAHEDLRPGPLSPYAASKLATEAYTLSYAHCFRLPVLAFRFFNVFGPLQPADHAYAAVIPAFVSAAVAGQPLTVHGDGRQTRDFTYVGSLCEVLAEAIRRRVTCSEAINLAFGSRRNLLDVIVELERILGCPLQVRHTQPRPGDVRDSQADQTRLRALFPDVQPLPFEEGLRATVEWFREVT